MCPCREARPQGWRSSAQYLAPPARTAGGAPGPEGYQVTSLIKSIESRLRDFATGESQQADQPRSDPHEASEAATALKSTDEDFVGVNTKVMDKGQSNAGSDLGELIGRNESDSVVSMPKLSVSLSHNKPEHDETVSETKSGRLSSIDKQTEDILIVLSVDDERHQQLEDTALMWQVRPLHALLLTFYNIACTGRHMNLSLSLCRDYHQPW